MKRSTQYLVLALFAGALEVFEMVASLWMKPSILHYSTTLLVISLTTCIVFLLFWRMCTWKDREDEFVELVGVDVPRRWNTDEVEFTGGVVSTIMARIFAPVAEAMTELAKLRRQIAGDPNSFYLPLQRSLEERIRDGRSLYSRKREIVLPFLPPELRPPSERKLSVDLAKRLRAQY